MDFNRRRNELATLNETDWMQLVEHWPDGRIKFALTRRLLVLRQQHADLFTAGRYQPLQVTGRDAGEIVAFARIKGRDALIVAAATQIGRASEGGRCWPAAQAWDASLALQPFANPRSVLDEAPKNSGDAVSQLFGALPIAILHATHAGRTQTN